MRFAPNVPTFREQGYGIVMASLRGIAAPRGLPAPVRQQLVTAIERAAADPEFQAKAAHYFAPLRYLPPAKYEAKLKESEGGSRQLWQAMPWGDKQAPQALGCRFARTASLRDAAGAGWW